MEIATENEISQSDRLALLDTIRVQWQSEKRNTQKILTMVSDYLQILYSFKTPKDNETLYWYNFKEKYWQDTGKLFVKEESKSIIDDLTVNQQNEIINRIKCDTYCDRKIFNPESLIGFQNCVLDLDTMMILDHNKLDYLTKLSPVTYDQSKFPERFEKFLDEVLDPESKRIVLEIMAHCFMNDYRYQKSFIFLGEGDNGKSVLLSTLKAILGEENITGYQLQDFEKNQFAASHLFGKMANIAPDISSKAMYTTGTFKTLTGGDYASHNVKGKQSITFVNKAKLIFSCNRLPSIYEDTRAIWRRLCVINFQKIIPPERQDRHLLEKLTTKEELSGILNVLLFALFRLIERGDFKDLKSVIDTRNSYIRQSNVIHAYAENCLESDDFGWISNEELFRDLNDYAKHIGLDPKTQQSISKQLPMWRTDAYLITRKIDKKNIRGWKGIKINDWRKEFEK